LIIDYHTPPSSVLWHISQEPASALSVEIWPFLGALFKTPTLFKEIAAS
jgi:hypothetical protein